MDADARRMTQTPMNDPHRHDPRPALATVRSSGDIAFRGVACRVAVERPLAESGVGQGHLGLPGTAGTSAHAWSFLPWSAPTQCVTTVSVDTVRRRSGNA